MSEDMENITVEFENLSVAEAGRNAAKLKTELLDLKHDLGSDLGSINLVKDDESTMDFGTTLVLALGTPAIVAVAGGIAVYLMRTGTKIRIKKGDVLMENVTGEDAAKIVDALRKK